MASFFGIQDWFYKNVTELSGGQKQLLSLASVMVMQPRVQILDEPTSQLDPIAASDFLQTLGRINRELGTTVLLTEHRLEEALPLATHAAVMDGGRLLCTGTGGGGRLAAAGGAPDVSGHALRHADLGLGAEAMPPLPGDGAGGQSLPDRWLTDHPPGPCRRRRSLPAARWCWRRRTCGFKYEEKGPDIVRGLHMTNPTGEFVALLGGNGTGKSTTLRLLSEGLRPYRGTVRHRPAGGSCPRTRRHCS